MNDSRPPLEVIRQALEDYVFDQGESLEALDEIESLLAKIESAEQAGNGVMEADDDDLWLSAQTAFDNAVPNSQRGFAEWRERMKAAIKVLGYPNPPASEADQVNDESESLVAPHSWKIVSIDGHPPDGLYVALYKDRSHFVVCLCSYGNWEYFDADGEDPDADDEGTVRGYGWSESVEDSSGDGYLHQRNVVAYYTLNFDYQKPSVAAIRKVLTEMPNYIPARNIAETNG